MYLFISQDKQRTILDYFQVPGFLRSSCNAHTEKCTRMSDMLFGPIRKATVDSQLCVSQTGEPRAGLIRKAIVDI